MSIQSLNKIKMALQVYNECCKNCLFSPNRIVSPQRAKEILQNCKSNQSHFICHKATIEGKEIVCKTFYDNFAHFSQSIRFVLLDNSYLMDENGKYLFLDGKWKV